MNGVRLCRATVQIATAKQNHHISWHYCYTFRKIALKQFVTDFGMFMMQESMVFILPIENPILKDSNSFSFISILKSLRWGISDLTYINNPPLECVKSYNEKAGLWSEWHYATREIGGWIHIITSPSGRVIICIHTPLPELCNAIQITGQMPSRFYIIPSDINLSTNISVQNSFITSH